MQNTTPISFISLKTGGKIEITQGTTNGNKVLSVEVKPNPVTVTISETAGSQTIQLSGSDLPITEWNEREPLDVLIRCTQGDFKFYLNGKLIKTLASNYWHPDDGSFPTIIGLKPAKTGHVKFEKFSWTYSKKLIVINKSDRL